MDLPKYESLDTQVLGVSVDVNGALKAFAEKMGFTYPLLSDFSRDTVKKYGVMYDDPNSAQFRMAKRAYFVIDKQGIIRGVIESETDMEVHSREALRIVKELA